MNQGVSQFHEGTTYGEKYGPAMEITDEAAAVAYFERCVGHTMIVGGKTREEAERIERANLGYWAGYYDHETRARVEQLFHSAHPVFGPIAEVRLPTPEEAFELGVTRGKLAAGEEL